MKIEAISSITQKTIDEKPDVDAFEKLLNTMDKMNQNQVSASNQMQDVLLGKSDDASGALIALQKNEQALSYATVVRDKAIEGYKKILDMQI
jgi:flagellar hook-basal body complex protein FliE